MCTPSSEYSSYRIKEKISNIIESKQNLPENIGIVISGRSCAICFDKNICDRQYALRKMVSNVSPRSSSMRRQEEEKEMKRCEKIYF